MKIKELIYVLSCADPDADVYLAEDRGLGQRRCWAPSETVSLEGARGERAVLTITPVSARQVPRPRAM